MTGSGFSVLVLSSDGTRVRRLTIPRWSIGVSLGMLLVVATAQGVVWTRYLATPRQNVVSTRGEHVATMSQPPNAIITPPARDVSSNASLVEPAAAAAAHEAQQRQANEAIQRRLDKIVAEVTSWGSLHSAIWKSVGPDHQKARDRRGVGGAAVSIPTGSDGHPVSAQLDRLLVTVTEEGQKLRALNHFMVRAGKALAALPSRWPTLGPVNSEFGRRPSPWTGEPEFHQGIDIAANLGTPVTAPGPGTVVFAGRLAGYGNAVLLDHGHDVKSRFGHLQTIRVTRGQHVQRGELIGLAGSTGRSTGPHLHYEVIVRGTPVNPRAYMWE